MYYYIFFDGKIKDCYIDNLFIDLKKKDNLYYYLFVLFIFSVEFVCLFMVI